MRDINVLKKELKKVLKEKTQCTIQHTGWTCGTCFYSLSEKLTNMDWQTVLFVRGDYSESDLDNLPKNVNSRVERILKIIS